MQIAPDQAALWRQLSGQITDQLLKVRGARPVGQVRKINPAGLNRQLVTHICVQIAMYPAQPIDFLPGLRKPIGREIVWSRIQREQAAHCVDLQPRVPCRRSIAAEGTQLRPILLAQGNCALPVCQALPVNPIARENARVESQTKECP